MGKIITPDALRIDGATRGTNFSVTYSQGGTDLSFNGDPAIIIQMLYDSAQAYEHVSRTLITTVLIFADQKKIPLDQLRKHSYLDTPGKVIIDPNS